MNTARILKLARFIEGLHEDEFDLSNWNQSHGCGTVACIAGWGAINATAERLNCSIIRSSAWLRDEDASEKSIAKKDLGLDGKTANNLFQPRETRMLGTYKKIPDHWIPQGKYYHDVTPKIAGKVLRHLAKTGEVNWRIAFE